MKGRVTANSPELGILTFEIHDEVSGRTKVVSVDYSDVGYIQRFVQNRIVDGANVPVNRFVTVKF